MNLTDSAICQILSNPLILAQFPRLREASRVMVMARKPPVATGCRRCNRIKKHQAGLYLRMAKSAIFGLSAPEKARFKRILKLPENTQITMIYRSAGRNIPPSTMVI